MWPVLIATRALTSGTHLSAIMPMHPNTRLDLSAMYYTNMWCFPQQTRIVGVLRNTSPNKWWFVQSRESPGGCFDPQVIAHWALA